MKEVQKFKRVDIFSILAIAGVVLVLAVECYFVFELYGGKSMLAESEVSLTETNAPVATLATNHIPVVLETNDLPEMEEPDDLPEPDETDPIPEPVKTNALPERVETHVFPEAVEPNIPSVELEELEPVG